MIVPLQAAAQVGAGGATILVECNESNGEGGGLDAWVVLTAIKVAGFA